MVEREDATGMIAEAVEEALALFPRELLFRRQISRDFCRESYILLFNEYTKRIRPAVEALNHAFLQTDQYRGRLLEEFSKALSKKIIALSQKDLKAPYTAKQGLLDARFLVSAYLIPSIIEQCLEISESLTDCIIDYWNQKYPKNKLTKATFEQIFQGFNKQLCYITTAICQSSSKPDDCYELTTLRRYRDGWLSRQPDGKMLIHQYYLFAPSLVSVIEGRADKEEIYRSLCQNYLMPCIERIEQGDEQGCKQLYVEMVEGLEEYL